LPILEKLEQSSQARHWTDSIPLEYHYTVGVAGEEFRRELKDNGKFLASKCSKCKTTYLPARLFCPACFVETRDRVTVDSAGYVYSYTTLSRDRAGEHAKEPLVVALVKFEGVKGGIVHRLDLPDKSKLTFGMKVQPVLKPATERTGALTDILGFRQV